MRQQRIREARAVNIERQEECLVITIFARGGNALRQTISRKVESVLRFTHLGPLFHHAAPRTPLYTLWFSTYDKASCAHD